MRKLFAIVSLLVVVNAYAQKTPSQAPPTSCRTGDTLVGSTCVADPTVAPEIDPASAAGGFALLAAVAIIRGRRVGNKPA